MRGSNAISSNLTVYSIFAQASLWAIFILIPALILLPDLAHAQSAYCIQVEKDWKYQHKDRKTPPSYVLVLTWALNKSASCSDANVYMQWMQENRSISKKWVFDCNGTLTTMDGKKIIDKHNFQNHYDEMDRSSLKTQREICDYSDCRTERGDKAIAACTRVIDEQTEHMFASHTFAYRIRGRTQLYSGALAKALADLSKVGERDPEDAYVALWLDIARRRNNVPSRLSETMSKIDMAKWPAPVIRMFLGQMTSADVFAAADDSDAEKKKGQVCEANFYSGELALLQGTKDEAIRLFRLAASDCPRGFIEWDAANAQLKVLSVNLSPKRATEAVPNTRPVVIRESPKKPEAKNSSSNCFMFNGKRQCE